jgi:hypothetical protein
MNDIERLKKTVCDLHGCDSAHAASIAIHETFQGETAWQGIVEVFFLVNHPQAKKAYAWTYQNEVASSVTLLFLMSLPLTQRWMQVRAYIAAERQKRS